MEVFTYDKKTIFCYLLYKESNRLDCFFYTIGYIIGCDESMNERVVVYWMIKWIVFDMMGVIFTVGDDTNDLLVPYIWRKNAGIPRKFIVDTYMDASMGCISSEEFWRTINVCEPGKEKEMSRDYLDTCLTLNETFLSAAKKLKGKYKLAILSNDVSDWSTYLRKKYELDDFIEFSVISGDVNLRKPDQDIYRLAIERTGGPPRECLFIDDRDKNLIAASKEEMNVLKFSKDGESNPENIITIADFGELEKVLEKYR